MKHERKEHVPVGATVHHERGLRGTYVLDDAEWDDREIPRDVNTPTDRVTRRVVPCGDWCRQGEGAE